MDFITVKEAAEILKICTKKYRSAIIFLTKKIMADFYLGGTQYEVIYRFMAFAGVVFLALSSLLHMGLAAVAAFFLII